MSNKLPTLKQFKSEAKLLSKETSLAYNASLEKLSNKYGFKNYQSIRPQLKPKYKSSISLGDDFYINGEWNIMELNINIGEFDDKDKAMEYSKFLRVKFVNDSIEKKIGYSIILFDKEIDYIDSDIYNEYLFVKKKYINRGFLERYCFEKKEFTLRDMSKYFKHGFMFESMSYGFVKI